MDEQKQIEMTCMTPGWKLIVGRMKVLVEAAKFEAFSCTSSEEVLEKWHRVRAAQDLFEAFLEQTQN